MIRKVVTKRRLDDFSAIKADYSYLEALSEE
jgi:hypothetical protein